MSGMRYVVGVLIAALLILSVIFLRRGINNITYFGRNDFKSGYAEVTKLDTCTNGSSPLKYWSCVKLKFVLPSNKVAMFHDESLRKSEIGDSYQILYKSEEEVMRERFASGNARSQSEQLPDFYFESWEAQRADFFGWPHTTGESIARSLGSLLLALLLAYWLTPKRFRRVRP
jgi:hypothetical protein